MLLQMALFHSLQLNSVFSRAKVFNVDEVQLINFFIFIDFAFGFKSKNSLTPDH